MKKFILKCTIFIIIMAALIAVYCSISSKSIRKYIGINTSEQIITSFDRMVSNPDSYDCLFLGNSRIFRGINPEKFPTVSGYNFGQDNETYNQVYYKLKYVLDNGVRPKYIILGIDYHAFSYLSDSKNYVYASYFPKEFLDDYDDADSSFLYRKTRMLTNLWSNKQNAFEAFMKDLFNKTPDENIPFMRENGQYVIWGEASADETVDRDYNIMPLQWNYYQKIIDLCIEYNIELYDIMPPLWEGETKSHSDEERKVFDDMIRANLAEKGFEGHYFNYFEENGLSSYTDFIDVTHLKPEAADEFSKWVNKKVFGE